jgi:hypothetical protein
MAPTIMQGPLHLSHPPATVLALWSVGMVLTRSSYRYEETQGERILVYIYALID